MLWHSIQHKLADIDNSQFSVANNRPVVYIDTQHQLLCCVSERDSVTQYYPVSTSRFGLGQQQGSFKTPGGIHRIAQKIGADEPLGRVFKSRVPADDICLAEDFSAEDDDVITSRILWLEGLQPGLNRGAEVDTYQRYIYIHGTADEAHIGQPASIGCIRMRNMDVISLFDLLEVGDLVVIE
ncbi:MAG: L,D-transpeptidase [Gammaproteobacteria bacterium]|nr:L,D-transpeptidase [Gammaproteobacteria bacterium]MBL6998240.1 L,D-transpeptidase [Gammaproteobacteria bacterium]